MAVSLTATHAPRTRANASRMGGLSPPYTSHMATAAAAVYNLRHTALRCWKLLLRTAVLSLRFESQEASNNNRVYCRSQELGNRPLSELVLRGADKVRSCRVDPLPRHDFGLSNART